MVTKGKLLVSIAAKKTKSCYNATNHYKRPETLCLIVKSEKIIYIHHAVRQLKYITSIEIMYNVIKI